MNILNLHDISKNLLIIIHLLFMPLTLAHANSTNPPENPFVRIEIGQHTALINKLSLDIKGNFVATASDDKTVRLWSLSDGTLLDTLRVPIDSGLEGALYAVAISPDGRSLVTAGYTGRSWDDTACIYLFDLEKKTLKARLASLPAFIHHIAYSPDGKVIVAALGGKSGIRIWNSTNGKILSKDDDYNDVATFLDFDSNGRLAVVSFDGFIRLYDSTFNRIKKVRLLGGRKANSVAFSPDGKLLAVGYDEETPKVDVLNAVDLSHLYSPKVSGLKGSLGSVAWIDDNKQISLVAAGNVFNSHKDYIIRSWDKAGNGIVKDIPVSRDTIMNLKSLPGGGLLFASADPAWGLIDPSGKTSFVNRGLLNDFRNVFDGRFAMSSDGLIIEFGTQRGGLRPFRFDVKQQELASELIPGSSLFGPVTNLKAIPIKDWRNNPSPKLSGKSLTLDKGENSLSLAIAPDGASFLIGGDYFLHLFDESGVEIKSQAIPGAAWGVNIARNGKVAIAALGDGSVRWYSLVKGSELEEIAALFALADGNTWVSWTPEGFFSHSNNGGEKLIGYHFNHGKSKPPEFISIEQTYQTYYSPRLVSLKIQGDPTGEVDQRMKDFGNVSTALTKKPVPKIDWVEYCITQKDSGNNCHPITTDVVTRDYKRTNKDKAGDTGQTLSFVSDIPPGTSAIKLHFKITDRGGGIGGIDVLQNEKIAGTTRDYRRSGASSPVVIDGVSEREISLQTGENTVRLKAFDGENGNYEVSSLIGFRVAAQTRAADQAANHVDEKPKPRLFVIAAGIDEYPGDYRLGFPVKDADAFRNAIKNHLSSVYKEEGGFYDYFLKDKEVTIQNLRDVFEKVAAKNLRSDDSIVIYLAGHGGQNDRHDYLFNTSESLNCLPDKKILTDEEYRRCNEQLDKLSIGQTTILDDMSIVNKAGRILLLLDTCHSGAGVSGIIDRSISTQDPSKDVDGQREGVNKIGHSLGDEILVLSAASASETSLDAYQGEIVSEFKKQHGVFSVAVLLGLEGKGLDPDGNRITYTKSSVNAVKFGIHVSETLEVLANEGKHAQKADFKHTGRNLNNDQFTLTDVAKK